MMLKNLATLPALLLLLASFAMPLTAADEQTKTGMPNPDKTGAAKDGTRLGDKLEAEVRDMVKAQGGSPIAKDQPFDEATHAANVAKYGQSYLSTLADLKVALKDDDSKILARLSDGELLALAFAIETISRKTLDEQLASKVKSAENSVPSLFKGMMVFSAALLALALFCVMRIKTQSKKLAELEARLKETS